MVNWKPLKNSLRHLRRRVYEFLGDDRYSRPSLYDLDRKLEKYLDFDGGFFVELGANDGYSQSNTYYFEAIRRWQGILIEPIPDACAAAARLRRRSRVFNCACVSFDYPHPYVEMTYGGLMSVVNGALRDPALETAYTAQGSAFANAESYRIRVPARTLTAILDEAQVQHIDLLSLDVEGSELQVLKGLDFDRYRPRYMLVEAYFFREEIEAFLRDTYEVVEQLTGHDILYRWKQPPNVSAKTGG